MKQYLDMAADALAGKRRGDRTKVGTYGKFGHQIRFDLTEGFPLVTTKKVFTRGIFEELKWFLRGETNAAWLQERGVNIWNDWALKEPVVVKQNKTSQEIYDMVAAFNETTHQEAISFITNLGHDHPTDEQETALDEWMAEKGLSMQKDVIRYPVGECGPVYGKQFRRALAVSPEGEVFTVDQMKKLMHDLKIRPYSRRHVVTAWSLGELPDESISPIENVKQGRQSLAACHTFFQLYVEDMEQDEAIDRCTMRSKYELESIAIETAKLGTETLEILDAKLTLDRKIQEEGGSRADYHSQFEAWAKRLEVLEARVSKLQDLTVQIDQYVGLIEARDVITISSLPNKRLSCQLYQRSADTPIGVPFNIASYAAMTQLMAEMTGMLPGDFIHTFGDYHVYTNQVEKLQEQLQRDPRRLPSLRLSNIMPLTPEEWNEDPFKYVEQVTFDVIGYDSHPVIKYPDPAV